MHRARFLIPLLVAGLLVANGCRPAPPASPAPQDGVKKGRVTIEIVTDDGPVSLVVSDVATGATVESVMRQIDQIPISIRGRGTTAFVDRIGDKAAAGSEGWTYRIDGELADQGIGSTVLTPPATIRWTYGEAVSP